MADENTEGPQVLSSSVRLDYPPPEPFVSFDGSLRNG